MKSFLHTRTLKGSFFWRTCQTKVGNVLSELTLFNFPKLEMRSAHSLVYSNDFNAFSTWDIYALYLESPSSSHSSNDRLFMFVLVYRLSPEFHDSIFNLVLKMKIEVLRNVALDSKSHGITLSAIVGKPFSTVNVQ